ncbi:MAG TPA: ABC transporter substrate-binding protein [Steroidobacteraceae bacterium]|nr:ABC transporter substrate-binding protein [Steroidobacteraceae bacterium]
MNPRLTATVGAAIAALAWLMVPSLPLLPGVALAAAEAQASELGPQALMDDVSKRMFAALDSNRAAIRADPKKVYPLVDTILLPHFDTDYAAQLVLAQHWRSATPEQRKRFVAALYQALLHTYSDALADFTADRLKLLPFRGDPSATQATVHTEVTRSSGTVVPVDYRLRKTDDGWKDFDVIIEGISYVRNYRTDFGEEISQKGLEEVITRLEREGLDLGKPSAAKSRPPAASSH